MAIKQNAHRWHKHASSSSAGSTLMSLTARFRKGNTPNAGQANNGSSGFSFLSRAPKSENGKERHSDPPTQSLSSPNTIGLSSSVRSGISGLGSFFGYPSEDTKISAARQKLDDAIAAEQLADKALTDARKKVKEAKEQAKLLEREALEESKRAKAKQAEAKRVIKTVKGLGRHG